MPLQTLDYDGLVALLESRNRAQPVTIITETDPSESKVMLKGRAPNQNPFYGDVFHLAERNVFIGADYESCVNRQRDRESQPLDAAGDQEHFHAEELWFGKGEPVNKFLARHKEKMEQYLVYKPTTDKANKILTKQTQYYNSEGVVYSDEDVIEIKQWMRKPSEAKTQMVDKEVQWRTLKLKNLKRIAIGSKTYEVDIPSFEVASV